MNSICSKGVNTDELLDVEDLPSVRELLSSIPSPVSFSAVPRFLNTLGVVVGIYVSVELY